MSRSWRWNPNDPPAPLRENRRLQVMLVVYLGLWVYWAINPLHFPDWLLENILVWVAWIGLVVTFKKWQMSDLSYLFILLFLCLHGYGGHYSYIETPLGWKMAELLGIDRNPYDRLVHFGSGALLLYPIAEGLLRWGKMRFRFAVGIAISLILTFGAFYEMAEMWVAMIVAPELGHQFLGSQGDEWDAVRDLEAAWWGGVLALSWTWPLVKYRRG